MTKRLPLSKKLDVEKIVYFVRHGESEANVSPVFQPAHSPLTENGKKQADRTAERIAKISFETLVSSPLERARQTAEAIAKLTGKVPEYNDLFVERVKPSEIAGKHFEDEEAHKIWGEWEKSLYVPGTRIADGENYDDLVERAGQVLEFLKSRPEKTLVVVTHGYFLRTIIARVLLDKSLTPENMENFQTRATMENAGLSAIRLVRGPEDTRWRLWIYNDHAHLG